MGYSITIMMANSYNAEWYPVQSVLGSKGNWTIVDMVDIGDTLYIKKLGTFTVVDIMFMERQIDILCEVAR